MAVGDVEYRDASAYFIDIFPPMMCTQDGDNGRIIEVKASARIIVILTVPFKTTATSITNVNML